MNLRLIVSALVVLLCSTASTVMAEPTTQFIYRGSISESGQAADGLYHLRLTLYANRDDIVPAAGPVDVYNVAVTAGNFAVPLAFDALPPQLTSAWLEVAVASEDQLAFQYLPERSLVDMGLLGCPPSWELAGNAGTVNGTHFLGTTDNSPLEFRVRNGRGFRIEPSANFWNGLPLTINTLGGSHGNEITQGVRGATISGGGVAPGGTDPDITNAARNRVTDHYGTVAGGFNNRAGNDSGTLIDAAHATVGGGRGNIASGRVSTIGGGVNNLAEGEYSTVGGGLNNQATGLSSTTGGGQGNIASETRATVAGGENNRATALRSTVGGGVSNVAMGIAATVPGGSLNCAGAGYSFAGGLFAKVRPAANPGSGACSFLSSYPGGEGDVGTFVWNGALPTENQPLISTGSRQFIVRAPGGFYFGTAAGSISIPAGRLIHTSTGAHLTTGCTWTNSSSRALKTGFSAVDVEAVLQNLLSLPLTRWAYRDSPAEGLHLGPVAEDFHALFGLGASAETISTVDASGVALAAIQGLHAQVSAENARLQDELSELREQVAELRNALSGAR